MKRCWNGQTGSTKETPYIKKGEINKFIERLNALLVKKRMPTLGVDEASKNYKIEYTLYTRNQGQVILVGAGSEVYAFLQGMYFCLVCIITISEEVKE